MSVATLPPPKTAPAAAPAPAPTVGQLTRQVFGLDLRSLGVFRICLALVLLWDLQDRAWDLRAHYTDDGVLPIAALPPNLPVSFHILSGSLTYQAILFVIGAACAFGLLLGWRTRIMALLCWVFTLSLQARNGTVLQGGDSVLRNVLFLSLFLPLGEYFSLDARRKGPTRPEPRYLSMATVAYIWQICLIYWFAAIWKTDASWRTDGTALGIALHIDSLITPIGEWIRQFETLLKCLTFGSLYLEAIGPAVMLLPFWTDQWRLLVTVLFLGFHLGIGLTMAIGIFPWICMAAWLPLLPPWFWDRLLPKVSARLSSSWPIGTPLPPLSGTVNLILGFLMVYIFALNLRQLDAQPDVMRQVNEWAGREVQPPFFSRYLPPQTESTANVLGVQQGWGMFAPRPGGASGWFVFVGVLEDGSVVDLETGAPPTWERPSNIAAAYHNARWRRLLMNMEEDSNYFWIRPHHADYLRRQWERDHPDRKVEMVIYHYFALSCDPEAWHSHDPPTEQVVYARPFRANVRTGTIMTTMAFADVTGNAGYYGLYQLERRQAQENAAGGAGP
jgi:hypothetical protein